MSSEGEVPTMAYVTIGYENYVLPIEQAVIIADWLTNAEAYVNKYHGSNNTTTHHVYERETGVHISVMPRAMYQIAKLAGKPEKT